MQLHRIIVALIICLSYFQDVESQEVVDKNLVPNYSFENYRKKSTNIKAAVPWQSIATVDFYQEPIKNDTGIYRGAHTGNCYAGVRFQKKYKEFLQVKLPESLKRGEKYYFEYHIRLGLWSNAMLKSFGIYFSKFGYQSPQKTDLRSVIDTVFKKDSMALTDLHWAKISGVYKADGGERYVTLGNFSPNVKKDLRRINIFRRGFKEAYYFVDDISLKWIKSKDEIPVEWVGSYFDDTTKALEVKKEIKIGEKFPLTNIKFEKGHSYITPESTTELKRLAQFLFKNPQLVIQINGHSDNTGNKFKNQKISEDRARQVFEYLISKGVQNRMYFKGYGGQFPIASNLDEFGKAANRRVEFEIIK
ncbi:MAG: OmpA family protein [Bacteroidota bacterium]